MKKLQTTLCSIAFAILGVCIAALGNKEGPRTNTVMAATPYVYPHLPIDLQLSNSLKENKSDTVIIRDTVRVTNKPKKVRVPYRVTKQDTVYQTVLFVAIPEVREEKTSEVIDSICKVHVVDTTSTNVIHSTEIESQH